MKNETDMTPVLTYYISLFSIGIGMIWRQQKLFFLSYFAKDLEARCPVYLNYCFLGMQRKKLTTQLF